LTHPRPDSPKALGVHLAIGTVILTLAFVWLLSLATYRWDFAAVWSYREKLLKGWFVTIGISLCALLLSLSFGYAAALARSSRYSFIRAGSIGYTELIRGTPLLVQILLLFYVVFDVLGMSNRYIAGVLILSLFAGAYIGEILRAAIQSVPESQRESALALGFTPLQTLRFVIVPQAARQALPPLTGQFASLIKDSSLLFVIGVSEFTQNAREINSFTYATLESYLPLAGGYLLLTIPLSLLSAHLERKMRYAA